MNKKIRQNLFPVLAALIWGTAFCGAERQCRAYTAADLWRHTVQYGLCGAGPGALDRAYGTKKKSPEKVEPLANSPKDLVLGGICCGVALAMASFLQQSGISAGTSAGKAGFITALYIVLVPILGLFL